MNKSRENKVERGLMEFHVSYKNKEVRVFVIYPDCEKLENLSSTGPPESSAVGEGR